MSTKAMTPMKRLSNHFSSMESMVQMLGRPVSLHRHESKRGWRGYWSGETEGAKKGVENDYVRIYEVKEDVSIGFVFNYELVTPATISVTKLVGTEMTSSRNFEEDEFRLLMNDLNKTLRRYTVDGTRILGKSAFLDIIDDHFLSGDNNINSLDMVAEIERVTKECQAVVEAHEQEHGELSTQRKKKCGALDRQQNKVSKEISNSEGGKRLEEIREQLKALELEAKSLQKILSETKAARETECGVPQLKDEIDRLGVEMEGLNKAKDSRIENLISKLPTHVKKIVKSKLN